MAIPQSKKWLVDGFCRYTHRMVRRRFHAFGVQWELPPAKWSIEGSPIVVYANHIGWWDPIVAMLLRRSHFPDRVLYAPIDATALASYRVFSSMGFFGIELHTMHGAADFLKTSREVLAQPGASLWITPEGQFTDCRNFSQPLMPGLAHLAASVPGVAFLPLAIEYPFWEESHPLILVRIGGPLRFVVGETKRDCGIRLETAMRVNQQHLADDVIARRSDAFEYLIAPHGLSNSWYDTIRAWSAWYHGRPFDPRHSSLRPSRDP